MRVLDRLTAVVATLAFVLAGLGAPACAETLEPGTVGTVAHRSIVHDGPGHAPPELRTEFSGGPCGDHHAGIAPGDGPDDALPAALPRLGGTLVPAPAATRYRQPAVALRPRGILPTRAPPAAA